MAASRTLRPSLRAQIPSKLSFNLHANVRLYVKVIHVATGEVTGLLLASLDDGVCLKTVPLGRPVSRMYIPSGVPLQFLFLVLRSHLE